MKKYLLVFFSLIPTLFLSQSNLSNEDVTYYISKLKAAEGTYQIQMISSRKEPAIPITIIDKIENIRHQYIDKYIYLNSTTRIKVLSRESIEKSTFKIHNIDKVIYLNK